MTTKELLALKRGMTVFLKQMPISRETIQDIVQYANSIMTVSTFLMAAILLDKEMNRLDYADGAAVEALPEEFDTVMCKLEDYINKTAGDERAV